ncbi:MAG: 1-(5-phosphoribosyl)-5-[(5-phosphoribosylamino)methylideneamino] imidazole-4-carboxamide isomerase [Planctomycetes bacterium]|nr:1-(5-phosphoribosyl)-5-[(5-phosphoribosylamino)methylideneamino] imidazole-4-carboxamide isomerase [Planctomycetota bacterium]
MIIWAAIDILGSRCVRLERGQERTAVEYGSALEAFERWTAQGLRNFHVVDLDAAFGRPSCLLEFLRGSAKDVFIQAAGGIRSLEAAQRLIDAGARRVVVGSLLAANPRECERMIVNLGLDRVVAAIDVRDGDVRVQGWRQRTETSPQEALRRAADMGFKEALVTDIDRDGLLQGPNVDLYRVQSDVSLIASGGIASLGDLRRLAALPRVSGAVVGKALYEGRIDPRELLELRT